MVRQDKGVKVLIIGSGGREHALAWSLRKSPRVTEVLCAPGNAGIAAIARCLPLDPGDVPSAVQLALTERPDLVVIGPELPLSLGLADELSSRGIACFGPSRRAAMLETSKVFAKRFMQRHTIPTAAYAAVSSEAEGLSSLPLFHYPLVVKADGLAAGKGVVICATEAEAQAVLRSFFSGGSGRQSTVLIEEFLTGEELSFLVLSDGKHAAPLAPAQDHKRIGEGDTGPNTGGMGAYSTDGMLSPELREWILHHIVQPTLDGMAAEDAPFVGVLYCGLMMTPRGPMVLEYNARFGDPETQAILLRLDSDLLDALQAAVEGHLSEDALRWLPGASACVVASSAGYPGPYATGYPIAGLRSAEHIPETQVFHAGTLQKVDEIVTNGGRVLAVAARAPSLPEALARCYTGLGSLSFEGMYYRSDIGHRATIM